jgi:poly-gamma-glutamate capsule biosynthesis protein CapA/YwtB (metallophosphatase superfamily)
MEHGVVIAAVGDVLVDRPDPGTAFARVAGALAAADLRFGNCEGAYSATRERNTSSWAWVISEPRNFAGVAGAGFDVMSVANNHVMDAGYQGLADTLDLLRDAGIAAVGAGQDLGEARRPALLRRGDLTVAFLAYTCAWAPGFPAWPTRPGCATLTVHTIYRHELGQPGTRPHTFTLLDPLDRAEVSEDVRGARELADVVVVSLHGGIHNLPAVLADYERELAHLVIDAGADAVVGHHQHIIKGVELYRGKPIFYGVGNFVFDGTAGERLASSSVAREAFKPFAPFYGEYLSSTHHPEARLAMLVRLTATRDGLQDIAFVPVVRDDAGDPVPLEPGSAAFGSYLEYVRDITARASLNARFDARGEEIAVSQ